MAPYSDDIGRVPYSVSDAGDTHGFYSLHGGEWVMRGAPTHSARDIKIKLGFSWHCAYCGQSNASEREGCRSCQAPRTEKGER